MSATRRSLLVHLSFHYCHLSPPFQHRKSPHIVNDFMNQIMSLLYGIQVAEALGRDLVVDGFHIHFEDQHTKVPLSKIVDLAKYPVRDYIEGEPFTLSEFSHEMIGHDMNSWLDRVRHQEGSIQNLEVDCCFYFRPDQGRYLTDLRALRFHPIFYETVGPFLHQYYGKFNIVHYRMEQDVFNHFARTTNPPTPPDALATKMFKTYEKYMADQSFMVSGYFKPGKEVKFIPSRSFFEFVMTEASESKLRETLGLPRHLPMREILAVLDYILCTSGKTSSFLGTCQSTFSLAVADVLNDSVPIRLLDIHHLEE
jgi:hypothetical protein